MKLKYRKALVFLLTVLVTVGSAFAVFYLTSFQVGKLKTLVPWYFAASIYFNGLCVLWVVFVVPYYAFYFFSIKILKEEISKTSERKTKKVGQDQVKVSVIMPAYNEEKGIERNLKKNIEALKKTVNYEIIVVNDGSTDKTEEVVKSVMGKYPTVKLINHPKNLGKYRALNSGIREAKGEIIVCSDSDSYLSGPDIYSVVTSILENPEIAGMVGVIEPTKPELSEAMGLSEKTMSEKIKRFFVKTLIRCQSIEYAFACKIIREVQFFWTKTCTGIPGPFFAFRRDDPKIITYGKAFNDSIVEDFELATRINKKKATIFPSKEVVVYTDTPKSVQRLRKQRLRWGGGTLSEMLRYRAWKINPFYTLSLFSTFAAPVMLVLIVINVFLAALLFGISYLLLLIPFIVFNWITGIIYALSVKEYPLTTILVFPFYLWLLDLFRVEATLRVICKRKIKW